MHLNTNYPPVTRGKLVVWGLLASYPFGGMTWQVLHYLTGLRRLGFDVWYVEDSDRYLYSAATLERTFEYDSNIEFLDRQLATVGLADRWVFRPPLTKRVYGGATDLTGLAQLYREADAVLNLCGAQELHQGHAEIRRLVFLETDPVENQVRVAQGDADKISELDAYQHIFTYGENIGHADCKVPATRYRWSATRPPVVIDWWETNSRTPSNPALTTIGKFRHTSKHVRWQGEEWRWSKHYEFLRFIDLPTRSSLPLEIAISAINDDERAALERNGWITKYTADLVDPFEYRDYIQSSLGELTVAKEQYVKSRSGWFSDRSVCYLAAGRPVVTQETGFSKFIPTGEGLFAFSDHTEAVAAIDAIALDYARHSSAASEIAREYFATDRVLPRLLRDADLL